jgi:hypothetical protein
MIRRAWVWLFGAQGFDFVELAVLTFLSLLLLVLAAFIGGSIGMVARALWPSLH